jgi:hypothetical protein
MQAKAMKADRQRAAYALDLSDRASYLKTVAKPIDTDAMVAEYLAKKEAERVARAEAIAKIRAGLGVSVRVGLGQRYRTK